MTTRWTAPLDGATVQAVITMVAVASLQRADERTFAGAAQRAAERLMQKWTNKIDAGLLARHTALELVAGPTDKQDIDRAEVAIERVQHAARLDARLASMR
jgi:tRNA pseudouridine-54 N-methylase